MTTNPDYDPFHFGDFDGSRHTETQAMAREAHSFLADVEGKEDPRWLSLLGKSGTGKTMLAKQIKRQCKGKVKFRQAWSWPTIVERLRGREYGIRNHLAQLPFLLIDEIGLDGDTEFAKNELSKLAERRMGKWTIWTANLDRKGIAERLDPRIASRMKRYPNRVVTVKDAPDWFGKNGGGAA